MRNLIEKSAIDNVAKIFEFSTNAIKIYFDKRYINPFEKSRHKWQKGGQRGKSVVTGMGNFKMKKTGVNHRFFLLRLFP